MKLLYLAHPVRGDIKLNLAKAKRWLKWLTESREHPTAVIAPWLTDVEVWDDEAANRSAGLSRCRAVIQRCDELWLVGGRVSEGMDMERRWAMEHGLTVVDVTALGEFPPDMTEDEIVSMRFLNSPQIPPPDRSAYQQQPEPLPEFACSKCDVVISEPDELRHWTDGDLCVPCANARPPDGQAECEQRGDWCSAHNHPWGQCDRSPIPYWHGVRVRYEHLENLRSTLGGCCDQCREIVRLLDEDPTRMLGTHEVDGTLSKDRPIRCAKCLKGIAGNGYHHKRGRFWYCKEHVSIPKVCLGALGKDGCFGCLICGPQRSP